MVILAMVYLGHLLVTPLKIKTFLFNLVFGKITPLSFLFI